MSSIWRLMITMDADENVRVWEKDVLGTFCEKKMGRLIGRRGETIHALHESTGVQIQLQKGVIRIKGREMSTYVAMLLIDDLLFGEGDVSARILMNERVFRLSCPYELLSRSHTLSDVFAMMKSIRQSYHLRYAYYDSKRGMIVMQGPHSKCLHASNFLRKSFGKSMQISCEFTRSSSASSFESRS